MKIPYGLCDFARIRREGYRYVDRTDRLRTLEEQGSALLFIRPRRFGKSLWLRTMACYYDLRLERDHEQLFGNLAAGHSPTPLAHKYFVLEWDFSFIDPHGDAAAIRDRLDDYVNSSIETFARTYEDHLPAEIMVDENPVVSLNRLLSVVSSSPHRLYLLIDEYDNFANEIMLADRDAYSALVHADGPFKRLMKWVKAAMAGRGLERLFLTGVSPVVMSDLTSGLNIVKDIYLHPRLSDLCGFRDEEVAELVGEVFEDTKLEGTAKLDTVLALMRDWYNGYRFSPTAEERVYNPTLVLYFLDRLQDQGTVPEQMLDPGLAADEDKLALISRQIAGQQMILDVVQTGTPLEIRSLEERFTLSEILDTAGQDRTFLASFLYFFGMLTLEGRSPRRTLLLAPPNQVSRKLYIDQVRRFLFASGQDRSEALPPAIDLMSGGPIDPLLDTVERRAFSALSNRDYRWMNELAIKMVLLALLFDEVSYTIHSEPELDRGYADLCLLRRADALGADLYDLLFELKRLSLNEAGLRPKDLENLDRQTLSTHPPIAQALDGAESQLSRYAASLRRLRGDDLRLRCFAVVAVGFERIVAREISIDP